MNHKIINLLDFKYPSTLYNNESEQIFMKAVNSRKTKLVLKKTKLVLNENTAKKPVNKYRTQTITRKDRKKKQTLGDLGYTSKVKDSIRKDILQKAIKYFGLNGTIKKLDRLIKMHINNNSKVANIFQDDMLYVKTLH